MEENKNMKSFISDAVDCKGGPADRTTTGGWVSAALILGIEVSERLSTMGIFVNLVTYLIHTMHLPSATSSNIVTNAVGTAFLLSLLGGIIADSFLGRYWTITASALIHALGTCMLAISAAPKLRPPPCDPSSSGVCGEASKMQMTMFYIAVYTIAVGIGGIKSSVPGFGTDQFDQKDEKEKDEMAQFFSRYYLIISIGTLLAVTVIVYIQDHVGRTWGYGICAASMFLAVFAFLVGTKRYRYKKCVSSPIIQILQVIVAAIRKRKAELPSDDSFLFEKSSPETSIPHTDQYSWLDKGAIISSRERGPDGSTIRNPWRLCTVTKVEEVKMLIKIMPIFATTFLFWTIHAQMLGYSVAQCFTLNRSIGSFDIPPASFNAFYIGSIVINLTLYDRIIVPFWKQSSKGAQGFTNLQEIGMGLFFATLGMAVASLVEMRRLYIVRVTRDPTTTLPMNAFFLVPQFILVGIGGTFMYTGQLNFFITQSPKGMKALGTGLFLTTTALGFFGSSILVTVVKKVTGTHGWLTPNINNSRLDCFYALLAVLGSIDLGLYMICAGRYKAHPVENADKPNSGKV